MEIETHESFRAENIGVVPWGVGIGDEFLTQVKISSGFISEEKPNPQNDWTRKMFHTEKNETCKGIDCHKSFCNGYS